MSMHKKSVQLIWQVEVYKYVWLRVKEFIIYYDFYVKSYYHNTKWGLDTSKLTVKSPFQSITDPWMSYFNKQKL